MVNMLQIDNSVGAPNVLGCGGVFWHSGIPGFWHSGIPTFWHSGIPEFCDYPSFFGGGGRVCSALQDEGTTICRNSGKLSSIDSASHLTKPESSPTALCKPQDTLLQCLFEL